MSYGLKNEKSIIIQQLKSNKNNKIKVRNKTVLWWPIAANQKLLFFFCK